MKNREQIASDLSKFADVGEDAPSSVETASGFAVSFIRNGNHCAARFDSQTEKIFVEIEDEGERNFASYKGFIASDLMANLGGWADAQARYLAQEFSNVNEMLVISGERKSDFSLIEPREFVLDQTTRINEHNNVIIVIDGPAGIGKTQYISMLALERSRSYKSARGRLVLHVQSRGRILAFLEDLIAFSLQKLRLDVTYDQLPILVRLGLVTLAIDGFDELGDPNGYKNAWGQLGDLLSATRGNGSVILSGRDTFISVDRVKTELPNFNSQDDQIEALTLMPPSANEAKSWLRNGGWLDTAIDQIDPLFEEGSYALRPFFLARLKELPTEGELKSFPYSSQPMLIFLIDKMIEREISKFGESVIKELGQKNLQRFVYEFLSELAREMADNQAESIDEITLRLAAEATLSSYGLSDAITNEIVNRANVMVFLSPDERRNHRRFTHSQIMLYFLSRSTITSMSTNDFPRFLARNILGREFLNVFIDVLFEINSREVDVVLLDNFMKNLFSRESMIFNYDRSQKNVSALQISSLSIIQSDYGTFQNLVCDEALLRGYIRDAKFENLVISLLDVRGADLTKIVWSNCHMISVVCSDGTKFPEFFPLPSILEIVNQEKVKTLTEESVIRKYLIRSFTLDDEDGDIIGRARSTQAYALLNKLVRVRSYWISDRGNSRNERLLDHDAWQELSKLLKKHDLLKEERSDASGPPSNFYHLRRADELLADNIGDDKIREFYKELASLH